jgi:hypothetical protein
MTVRVWWENDPRRYRFVRRACAHCSWSSVLIGEKPPSVDYPMLVSPSGLSHHADGDTTMCGKDATGPGWWWRS